MNLMTQVNQKKLEIAPLSVIRILITDPSFFKKDPVILQKILTDSTYLSFFKKLGMIPFIYHQLKKNNICKDIPSFYRAAYLKTAGLNLQKQHEMLRVIHALKNEGISAVPLKGMALIETVYPKMGVRPMCDVDLLIRPKDISRAKKIFQSLAFRHITSFKGSHNFHNEHKNVAFDVHTKFVRYDFLFNIDYKEIHERLMEVNINKTPIFLLCPEHQLIHISLHLAPGLYTEFNFINFLDLYYLIKRNPSSFNWRYVMDFSERIQASQYIYSTLFLLNHMLDVQLPGEISSALRQKLSQKRVDYLLDRHKINIIEKRGLGMFQTLSERILFARGPKNKFKLFKMAFFPNKEEMEERLGRTLSTFALYKLYIIRMWTFTRSMLAHRAARR